MYSGKIYEIKHYTGDRGIPKIPMNNKWHYPDISDSNVTNYIHVGDSILKDFGSDQIEVFRKNENG